MEYINKFREIREEEVVLLKHMLTLANLSHNDFPYTDRVFEYEGGKMGSINFDNDNTENYLGDIMVVEFKDIDDVRVVVTLTIDKDKKLLDLDFWKEDFSALRKYPTPQMVTKAQHIL